jgi:hypothetical protein
MLTSIPVTMRIGYGGAGVYEVGTNGVRMFITDGGFVIPMDRMLSENDLFNAFDAGVAESGEVKRQRDEAINSYEPEDEGFSSHDYPHELDIDLM